jgi:hypothetical protein
MENLTAKLKPIENDSEVIVLLHGLARTSRSMSKAGTYWLPTGIRSLMSITLRVAQTSVCWRKNI